MVRLSFKFKVSEISWEVPRRFFQFLGNFYPPHASVWRIPKHSHWGVVSGDFGFVLCFSTWLFYSQGLKNFVCNFGWKNWTTESNVNPDVIMGSSLLQKSSTNTNLETSSNQFMLKAFRDHQRNQNFQLLEYSHSTKDSLESPQFIGSEKVSNE